MNGIEWNGGPTAMGLERVRMRRELILRVMEDMVRAGEGELRPLAAGKDKGERLCGMWGWSMHLLFGLMYVYGL